MKRRPFAKRLFAIALAAMLTFPICAYAAETYYFGPTRNISFTDLTYKIRSGLGRDASSSQVYGRGWSSAINRSVGAGAMENAVALYKNNGGDTWKRVALADQVTTRSYAANELFKTTAYEIPVGSGTYETRTDHLLRNPITLKCPAYRTECRHAMI